jgi:hypothetical protein
MRDHDAVLFEQKVLKFVKFRAAAHVSRELFAGGSNLEFHVREAEWTADRLLVDLTAHVLEDPEHRCERVLRFVEQPVYRSWRQHLVASLPPDCFRRRFLERLWGIDAPDGTRVVHEVRVAALALFPYARHQYPRDAGPVQWVRQIESICSRETER